MSKRKADNGDGDEAGSPKKARTGDQTWKEEPVRDYLAQYPLESFLVRENLSMVLHQDASLFVALTELAKRGLHWAPVTDGNFVIGTIGLPQIVQFIVKTVAKADNMFSQHEPSDEILRTLVSEERFNETSVKDIVNSFGTEEDAKRGKAVLDIQTSLVHAIDLMSYGQHRFVVVKDDAFHGILSHTDVVAHLAQHIERLGPIAERTIEELDVGLETVVRVHRSAKVIEAFSDIAHWKINGIAVLGDHGVLVGNISASDLRVLVDGGMLDMTALYLSAEEFIKLCRQRGTLRHGTVVAVREYDTIANLLRIFAFNKVQRVFVVDGDGKLKGVITIRDLLTKLVPPHVPPMGNTSPRPSDNE